MIMLVVLVIALFLFGTFVVGMNSSLKKQNEELLRSIKLRNSVIENHKKWVAELTELQPMEAALAIHEQHEKNRKVESRRTQ